MAWTAEDCAIMLQVLAGHDPADPASATQSVPHYRDALSGHLKDVRIGVIRHFHEQDYVVEPAVQTGIDNALTVFRSLGATTVDVAVSPLQDWHACGSLISITERAAAYEEWAQTRLGDFSERVQRRLHLGALVSGVDYVQAARRRRELRAELQAAMRELDVVITAGAPGEAARMDAIPKWDLFDKPNFTMPFNVTGYPALCVCSGFGPGGLPVSVQIVGKPFQDAMVLRVGDAFEKATHSRSTRPAIVA
jgi:aspartyl-tRNA(Asn)/glutamyl-tRNA(Gln) amidotransferase subunit A